MRRPMMAGSEASENMRALDPLDERALRVVRAREVVEEMPTEPEKKRVYNTRIGKKRITTLIEPAKHHKLKIATAIDGIAMEEAVRIGLDLYLAQSRKEP